MTSIQNKTDTTSRKMISHFKSTNHIESNAQSNKFKVRRDMSTISNYYVNTQRKYSDNAPFNKLDSKSLLDSYLPDINSKHRSQKRSSFLEMWLQEALDPQDSNTKDEKKTVEVQKTGPLRTVQKFQIDKKYLKSQNITGQVIDKLYNSLYVYTYGINNTFSQILALTKTSQHAQKKIINSFWKAFIKLLQGCTSYRTAFQVIEQTYQKQQIEIRQNFAVKQAEFNQQRERLEQQINKLNKKISEQSNTISKLTSDYNIAQSTLHLTDQAFNEQVNLRLKFQEKVNAVFTSYEEIKMKYDKILTDLRVKGDEQVSTKQILINLRAQLQQSQIKNIESNRQIERLQQIIKERQAEINVKRQQIYELTSIVKQFNEKKDESQQQIRKIVTKLDNYRQKYQNVSNQIIIKSNLIKQYQKRVNEQQKLIQAARLANEKVYEKYQSTGKLLGDFNAERIYLQNATNNAIAQSQLLKVQKDVLKQKLSVIQVDFQQSQHKILDLTRQLETKNNYIQKNVELIRDLQAVKDKFQRLYTITSTQKRKMEDIMNEAVRLKLSYEEEMTGMKMLLQNRNTELDEANNKLQNQREVFRSKIASLKDEISMKQAQILEFHDKQLLDQQIVTNITQKMKGVETEIKNLTEEVLRLQSQLIQQNLLLNEASTQRSKNRQMFKQLNSKLEEISKQHINSQLILSNKQSLLQQIRGKADKQKQLLRKLLQSYREDRQKKVCYIHPMIYEDCRMQIDRNTICIESQKIKIKDLEQIIANLNKKCEQQTQIIGMLRNGLIKAQALNKKRQEQIEMLTNQKNQLEQKIKNISYQYALRENNFRQKQNELNIIIQNSKQKIVDLQEEIIATQQSLKNEKKQCDELEDQIKIQNIHHMAQEDEISNLKSQIIRLKEQLGSYKRGDSKNSARTQALKRKGTLNQQRQSISSKAQEKQSREITSRNQERQKISVSKHSNHVDTFKSQQNSLKPIEEQQRKQGAKQKLKIDGRPSTVQREAQTEKQKPKFTHSFKFEPTYPNQQSYGCQVDIVIQQPQQIVQNNYQNSHISPYKSGRIEGEQFKRALKITYMRR